MVSSFLSYKVDRKLSLSHSFLLFLLPLHLFLCMRCTLLFLLFPLLLLYLSNSMLPCSSYTTYYSIALSPGSLVLYFLLSLSPYSHILCTPQTSPLLRVWSTPPCTLLLSLGAAPLLHYASSSSPILLTVVLLPLLSFFSFVGTSTSCVLLAHI